MKEKNYSIRLSEEMQDFIKKEARKYGLLPSEYLRNIIYNEMRGTRYGNITKTPKE